MTKSFNVEGDDNLDAQTDSVLQLPPENTEKEITAVTSKKYVSTAKPPKRKHKKLDEIDLKILKALERKEPEKPNSQMSFFHSLMPHLEKFDDNELLQFQMGVLQVISNIKTRKPAAPDHQHFFTPSLHNSSITANLLHTIPNL